MGILSGLLDSKVEKILKVLCKQSDELFHLSKIADKADVSLSTTFRIVNHLCRIGVIKTVRVGKLKLYSLTTSKKIETLAHIIK
jgi:DNA-binding IclR family transcriptional regulator